jgi:voltage-gated potassium channel Kch
MKLSARVLRRVDELTIWRAMRLVVLAAVAVVASAAVLERIVEPRTFDSFGLALWWAVVTVGTVGYGDVVPHTPAGRAVAAAVILFSMAFIPTVTALVVATLFNKIQRRSHASDSRRLDEILERLARLERAAGVDERDAERPPH